MKNYISDSLFGLFEALRGFLFFYFYFIFAFVYCLVFASFPLILSCRVHLNCYSLIIPLNFTLLTIVPWIRLF
jgi:hypothetical protein